MIKKIFFSLFRIASMNYSLKRNNSNVLYALMFHQVNNDNSSIYPAVPNDVFEGICNFCSKNFNIIYIREIEDYFKKPRKAAVVISFDDGHYDILKNAFPVLNKYRLKFNVNIVTESMETGLPQDSVRIYDVLRTTEKEEYINTDILPNPIKIKIDRNRLVRTEKEFVRLFKDLNKDERRLLSKDVIDKLSNVKTRFSRMLSKEDILYLSKNGAEIGSHTHSHPVLPNIGTHELEFELAHSKRLLKNVCGERIDILAFPQGRYNRYIIDKAFEAGYRYLLLASDSKNILYTEGHENIYDRIGLYYKTLDENLAKIFGFHQTIYRVRDILR